MLLSFMKENRDVEYDYAGWHLYFDSEKKWVRVTDNGTDKTLAVKFVPAEMSYKTLTALINKEDIEDLEIRYLE